MKLKKRNVTPLSSPLSADRSRRDSSSSSVLMTSLVVFLKHIFLRVGEKIQSEFVKNLWQIGQVVYQAAFVEKRNQIK